jgi:hypothetical protein
MDVGSGVFDTVGDGVVVTAAPVHPDNNPANNVMMTRKNPILVVTPFIFLLKIINPPPASGRGVM